MQAFGGVLTTRWFPACFTLANFSTVMLRLIAHLMGESFNWRVTCTVWHHTTFKRASAFQIWKSLLLQICISMALASTRELHAPLPPSAAHALLVVAMDLKLAVNNNCVSWGLNRKPRTRYSNENEVFYPI